jgi:hypothetical protein
MAFNIKQLLFCVAVVAFGLVALFNAKPVVGKLFDLLTLGILIATAYGAWLSYGEFRAFRVGFLCWAILYFLLFKKKFDVGIYDLINLAYRAVQPPINVPPPFPRGSGGGGFGGGGGVFGGFGLHPNFNSVCHSLFLLLLGVVGGCVTVYYYRKRHRLLASRYNEGRASDTPSR